ncbi:MAG: HEPN domain-containing protein [Candidatus Omnitrophota bacterium]
MVYFLNQIELKPAESIGRFIIKLNEASVATRYPEDLEEINKNYTKVVVQDIIVHTKEVLEWIKQQF